MDCAWGAQAERRLPIGPQIDGLKAGSPSLDSALSVAGILASQTYSCCLENYLDQ